MSEVNTTEFWQSGELLKVWQNPRAEGWRPISVGDRVILNDREPSAMSYKVKAVVHTRFPTPAMIVEVGHV